MAAPQQFSLRWNNYSQHIVTALDDLRADDELTDVTLSCDGQRLKAHKILLAACSSFFRDTFKENPCKHPIIIIKGVSFTDLEAVTQFMYNGQVNVSQDRLQTFLAAAELLQIKGLTDVNDKEEPAKKRPPTHPPGNSTLNHNNSLSHSHSSRSGTPDSVQRPPSPKRKRAAVDTFTNDGASTSIGAFGGVLANNVGSPATSSGGGGASTTGNGISGGGLNSATAAGGGGADFHDPFQPKVSIKYEDEQDEDEYDDKANLSSEDNDNSMQDIMCNVEPGSIGSFMGGSGTGGLGASGTDSSHGFTRVGIEGEDETSPQVCCNAKGYGRLYWNGFTYLLHRTIQGTQHWRCKNRKKCRARVQRRGEDSSQDLLRPLDPTHFQLPSTILNVDGGGPSALSPPPLVLPTVPKRSFQFPLVPPSPASASPAPPATPTRQKIRVTPLGPGGESSGTLEIRNVFSLSTSSAARATGDHRRLISLLQRHPSREPPAPSSGGGSPETTNTCEVCGKRFTLRTNLTAHKKLHVRGATTCKWCSKTLSTIGNLRCHIQYVHSNAPHPPRRQYTARTGMAGGISSRRRNSVGTGSGATGAATRQRRTSSQSPRSQDVDSLLDPLHFLGGIDMEEGGSQGESMVILPN